MNRLFCILLGVILLGSVKADEKDFRCFKSINLKTPLKLQFIFQTDKDDLGFVSYQNGNGAIPVKLIKEKELKRLPGGRPSEFEAQWQEMTTDGTGGIYRVISQGAMISDFRYLRKKDGKVFQFQEDMDASTEKGCNWSTK